MDHTSLEFCIFKSIGSNGKYTIQMQLDIDSSFKCFGPQHKEAERQKP